MTASPKTTQNKDKPKQEIKPVVNTIISVSSPVEKTTPIKNSTNLIQPTVEKINYADAVIRNSVMIMI